MRYDIKAKDLERAAFAISFGLVVGKAAGELVGAAINGVTSGMIQLMAKHGNKVAQKACDENNIKYTE